MLPPLALGATTSSTTASNPCVATPGQPTILAWDGSNPINCITGFQSDPAGNIGIKSPLTTTATGTFSTPPEATLDVAGGIRIGTDQALPLDNMTGCDSAHEGSQRYNKANHVMEYCDGTNWSAMGGNNKLGLLQTACSEYGMSKTNQICTTIDTQTGAGCTFFANLTGEGSDSCVPPELPSSNPSGTYETSCSEYSMMDTSQICTTINTKTGAGCTFFANLVGEGSDGCVPP